LISKIKPGDVNFTKSNLVKEIFEELEWVLMHGEGFDKNIQSISEVELINIVYDQYNSIFVANFNLIEV